MKPEQQRIAIAEACGWKPDDDGAGMNTWEASYVGPRLYGLRPNRRNDGTVDSYTADCLVPDYLNDLNAMHEVEKTLKHFIDHDVFSPVELYERNLYKNCKRITFATAAQRAEAFLKTLKLWEES